MVRKTLDSQGNAGRLNPLDRGGRIGNVALKKGAGRIHVLVCPVSRDNRRLFCGGILHGVDVDVRALGKRATVRHSLWGSYVGISTAVERRGN